MLKGIDISKHNRWMKNPAIINSFDFVIMKATEGATYKDSFMEYFNEVLAADMLRGFYHFARPDNKNTPESEANNFLSSVLKHLGSKNAILALDVEDKALHVQGLDEWCLKWCKHVYSATGIKPMIYCSESETGRFNKCAAWGCGLWVAKWSILRPKKIAPWKFFAIWQKSNNHNVSGVRTDLDYFNGKKDQYLKYCGR